MESSSNKNFSNYECELCCAKLEKDHRGIRCKNDHHLCTDCTKPYIKNIIRKPRKNIPCKCGYCKAPMISNYSLI